MIYEKSSKAFNCGLAIASSLVTLLLAFPVCAQQNSGYTPPPMFEDMTPPMVRPQPQDGNIVEPKKSANPQLPPPLIPSHKPETTTSPRVSVDPDTKPMESPRPPVVPVPPKMTPIVEPSFNATKTPSVPVPPAKPQMTSPQKPDVAQVPPPQIPAPRDPSQSAITGPKTMPALPPVNVDKQVTFEDKKHGGSGETMLERQQKEAAPNAKESGPLDLITPAPNPDVTPATFENAPQGALKKTIPFQAGQIGLKAAEADPIAAGVVKELDKDDKKDWRVQIKSFATPHGNGLSSDRRIALSRALSLRSTLISQGVPASRIDVLAQGLQTEGNAPPDRIDLYLYGPSGR